ncbi:hypothetical protein NPIL_104151 [Nephila pilipes]|uniref:Uncharacterized protein n=1 Tax=Nephila pilipes TaxID=299642 RepID=A0A8X6USC3_NEPPI|nr:hypothetical protein NPIL_104151 [Nephila pilipes]
MFLRTKVSNLVLVNIIIYLLLTTEISCVAKSKDLATKGAAKSALPWDLKWWGKERGGEKVPRGEGGHPCVLQEFTSTLVDSMQKSDKKDKRN